MVVVSQHSALSRTQSRVEQKENISKILHQCNTTFEDASQARAKIVFFCLLMAFDNGLVV